MGFYIGAIVKVRHDLREDRIYNDVGVHQDMVDEFAGATVTIRDLAGTGKYRIKEDNGRWTWTADMLVELHNTVIESKHSISKIPGYGTVIVLEDGTRIYQSKEGHVVQLSTNSTLS